MSSGRHKHLFLFHGTVRVKLLDCNVCVCVLVCVCLYVYIHTHTHTHICSALIIIAKHLPKCLCQFMLLSQTVWWSCSVVSDSLPPTDCGPPGSSVHGILQTGALEWVATSSSGDLPNPGIKPTSPASPALAGGFFTTESPGKHQQL